MHEVSGRAAQLMERGCDDYMLRPWRFQHQCRSIRGSSDTSGGGTSVVPVSIWSGKHSREDRHGATR